MSTSDEDPFGWVGATVDGKYRVDAVVGHGGFGIVYLAHHLGFEEKVALKCLKLPKELQGGDRDRFRDSLVAEGRLLLQLSRATTGVVQALDVGAVVSPSKIWTPYLVLEWLEGTPLDRDLSSRRTEGRGGRSLGEAMELMDGGVRALAVAHELGIAHRDIKPANLFLVQIAGRPSMKVLDFGIAKVLSESASLTRAFEETGGTVQAFTARYAAPEQFSRRFGATGPWTDVFALALVLVEVVLGSPALDGTDAAQLFVAASDKLLRPTLRGRGFDPGDAVEAVLATALAVDPRERYPNAAAFWDALASAAQREPERLAVRPTALDDSRPTRDMNAEASEAFARHGARANTNRSDPSSRPLGNAPTSQPSGSGPSSFSTREAPAAQSSRVTPSSQRGPDAAPATELSSTQAIGSAELAPHHVPTRRGRKLLGLAGVAALAAAGTAGAVLWLNRERPPAGAPSGQSSIQRRQEDVSAQPASDASPAASAAETPSASPGAAAPLAPTATSVLKSSLPAWPGTQSRQVPAGALQGKALWLDGFRIVRRPELAASADSAFRACGELGLSLCTEAQWQLSCEAFPEIAKDRSFTDTIERGGMVERGGEACAARRVLPLSSGGEQLGLCCERAIGMSSKNLKSQFLSSTASVLKKLESALNQHDATALVELLDEKVKLDGVERSKASVIALLSQTFKASPDLIVTHEACAVTVQASKVVKRSKRGRKLTSYETNSWSANCQQVRHQRGEGVATNAEYVFSPASRLRGISAKNEATE